MTLRERFRLNLLGCNTHFEGDQLDAVMEIFESLGIQEMYEVLKATLYYLDHKDGDTIEKGKVLDSIIASLAKAEGR